MTEQAISNTAAAQALAIEAKPSPRLTHFTPRYALTIASWITNPRDLTMLAPGTVPPLDASKVTAWARPDGQQFLFWSPPLVQPCGYGELNRMPDRRKQLWLGHFVVSPTLRGRGTGAAFLRALLTQAFERLDAEDVALVVFPNNASAIRCYERNGMNIDGTERKHFRETGRTHDFLRMSIARRRYQVLRERGSLPEDRATLEAS